PASRPRWRGSASSAGSATTSPRRSTADTSRASSCRAPWRGRRRGPSERSGLQQEKEVTMEGVPETPGGKFFQEHMKYIYANDIDGMIDDQYTQDAVLISPFDVVAGKSPPHIVRGNKELKDFFHTYIAWQGSIDVESLYD